MLRSDFWFLSLFFFVAGCTLPTPQKNENLDASGSFYISEVTPVFQGLRRNEQNFIVTARELVVTACFKNNKESKSIAHHSFEITGGSNVKRETTNDEGCLSWSEWIEYNALSEANQISMVREAKAIGIEKGSATIHLVVNPWDNLVTWNRNPQNQNSGIVPESREAFRGARSQKSSIRLRYGRKTINDEITVGQQREVHVEVAGELSYVRTGLDGSPVSLVMGNSEFNFEYTIFYQPSIQDRLERRIIRRHAGKMTTLADGGIAIRDKFLVDGMLCTNGNVFLALKLTPVNRPEGLRDFEVVTLHGECGKHGMSFIVNWIEFQEKYEQVAGYGIEDYLNEYPEIPRTELPTEQRTGRRQAIQIAQPVRFDTINHTQRDGVLRQRLAQGTVCLKSGWDNRNLRFMELELTKIQGQTEKLETDAHGCFAYREVFEYNFLAAECWSSGEIKVVNRDSGFSEVIPIHYNLWYDSDTGFQDARAPRLNPSDVGCIQEKTELIAIDYRSDQQEIEYRTDQFLQVEQVKLGNLRIRVGVKRPSFTNAGYDPKILPQNLQVIIRIAVVDQSVKDFFSAENLVHSYTDRLVTIGPNSNILEAFELATRNIKSLGNRNKLVIEIAPAKPEAQRVLAAYPNTPIQDLIDHGMHVVPTTYVSPIRVAGDSEGGSFHLIPNSRGASILDYLQEQFLKDRAAQALRFQQMSDTKGFAENNNLELISLEDSERHQDFATRLANPLAHRQQQDTTHPRRIRNPVNLRNLIDQGIQKNTARDLCAFWFNDLWSRPLEGRDHGVLNMNSPSRSFHFSLLCSQLAEQNPHDAFDMETKYFLRGRTVNKGIQESAIPFRPFNAQYNFSMANDTSDRVGYNLSWDLGGSLRTAVWSVLGAGTGLGYSISNNVSYAENQAAGLSYSASLSMLVETLRLEFEATSYEKCLVVKLNPRIFESESDRNPRERSFFRSLSHAILHGEFLKGTSINNADLHPRLSDEEKIQLATKGFLICDGKPREEKKTFFENYYTISQDRALGSLLDNSTEIHRVFFANIRGEVDFIKFISYLQSSQDVPSHYDGEFLRTRMGSDPITEVFKRGTRQAPGVFTRIRE